MSSEANFLRDFLNFDFKKAREEREARVRADKAKDLETYLAGPTLESTTKCMRYGCTEMRWAVPSRRSVLCQEHTIEVLLGITRAPPLRQRLDYCSIGRRAFLVDLEGLSKDVDPKV